MKWEELTDKHAKEYVAHLNACKASLERVNQNRKKVLELANASEGNIPESLNNLLNRDMEGWKEEWGMYGSKFKEMRIAQQREVNQFFDKENLVYRLKSETENGQAKDKDGGR